LSAFFGALIIGMVLGAMLTSLIFGLLDLMKGKATQQEDLEELVRWKSSETSPEKSSSGEVGKISQK
jgi:hypothetical protein